MAQIASAFPTAGGLYHWSAILGGRGWGWAAAWFNLGGLIFVTAAVNGANGRDWAQKPALQCCLLTLSLTVEVFEAEVGCTLADGFAGSALSYFRCFPGVNSAAPYRGPPGRHFRELWSQQPDVYCRSHDSQTRTGSFMGQDHRPRSGRRDRYDARDGEFAAQHFTGLISQAQIPVAAKVVTINV